MNKVKSFTIPKMEVWNAYLSVKRSKGGAGFDEQTMEEFEHDLKNNLYKIWNRLSSGSYFPTPVLKVEIPKSNGKLRELGIPTIEDRIAQTVIKGKLEKIVEPHFHKDSYGYRPNKSALMALETTRKRCWRDNWVLDLDMEKFFDTLDHELVLRAVRKFTESKLILLYVERWLKVDVVNKDGARLSRASGTPQGGVISPLFANIFMHLAFDSWMENKYPSVHFERYADDIVVHCRSHNQLKMVQSEIKLRLEKCRLKLNEEKTRVVYCKDTNRKGNWPCQSFTFLGYCFRPRSARNKEGKLFVSFSPGISQKASKSIRDDLRSHRGLRKISDFNIKELSKCLNPVIRGWVTYFTRFNKSAMNSVFNYINYRILKWAIKKYKRFKGRVNKANKWLKKIHSHNPSLFAHWTVWKWTPDQ